MEEAWELAAVSVDINLIGYGLGFLGALSGFAIIWTFIGRPLYEAVLRFRAKAPRDFSYEKVVLSSRIWPDNNQIVSVRTAKIKSRCKSLNKIRFSAAYPNASDVKVTTPTNGCRIEKVDAQSGRPDPQYEIILPQGLPRGKKATFKIKVEAIAKDGLELNNFLNFGNSRGVKRLILEIAREDDGPCEVSHKELNSHEKELETNTVPYNEITRYAVWREKYVPPNFSHSIIWNC